jgi:putative DNA primase/helicase
VSSKGVRAYARAARLFPHTDSGNAELLVSLYGRRFRFVKSWGRFIVWTGTHWEEDVGGIRVGQLAKKAVRQIRATKWRKRSESRQSRRAIVDLVREEKNIAIALTDLDVDPWLLNVENGTIDLRTGKLRDHTKGDLITKLAPVTFDADASCSRWRRFLLEAMGQNQELVDYLQRFAGYSLTGLTREQSLIFHYGDGNNGKSTFITTLHKLLGSYATRASRGLFFKSRHERHPTSIASLYGRRFVSVPEVDEDQEWDEGLIKDNTGDDPLNARRMREDEWTFIPTHKLWFAANNKPRTKGTDLGIWRRMQIVPWEVTIAKSEVDPRLPAKLFREAPGILNWCVEGCLMWQRTGLSPPPRVLAATAEYRKDQDVVGKFFDDLLVFEPTGKITRPALRQLYESWCEDLGHLPVGARRFTQALRRHHVSEGGVWDKERSQPVRGWHGVRAITSGEHAQRELSANDGGQLTDRERARLQRVIDREKRKSAVSAKPDAPGGNVYTMRKDKT